MKSTRSANLLTSCKNSSKPGRSKTVTWFILGFPSTSFNQIKEKFNSDCFLDGGLLVILYLPGFQRFMVMLVQAGKAVNLCMERYLKDE